MKLCKAACKKCGMLQTAFGKDTLMECIHTSSLKIQSGMNCARQILWIMDIHKLKRENVEGV
jgi:hypothetical protein